MKKPLIPNRKRYVVFSVLLCLVFSSYSQTIVNVLVNQPKKLEIAASELFSQTANSMILGAKVIVGGGVSPYRYAWSNDGKLIGTSLILEVPINTPTNGLTLTVKDTKNCSCLQNIFLTDSKDMKDGISGIVVYPNPASTFIVLDTNDLTEILEVSFYDLRGVFLLKKQVSGRSVIDFKLPPGLYVLRVVSKNKQIEGILKLIVR